MILLVNSIASVLLLFIIWWFWLSSPRAQKSGADVIDITVDNGVYSPSIIEVRKGQNLTMRFLRKDASPCAEKVIFKDLNLSADLPVDKKVDLRIPTNQTGEFSFTCQMQMYRGTLLVK
ncbi:MAG: cupredoxin domain-containing protein [Thioalkalispiraceae bacterium]|jgi:plastocyanin domain-containing protein